MLPFAGGSQKGCRIMPSKVNISGLDFSGEGTSFGVNFPDVTSGNFDAVVASLSSFQAAVKGVSLIGFDGKALKTLDVPRETVRPVSPYAQREAKWLVTCGYGTGNLLQFSIGGPDLTQLASDGSTLDVSTGTPGEALVTSIEANVVGPAGEAVTFVSAVHVGRNN